MGVEKRNLDQENFDHWLGTALRIRAEGEPRMGLEDRVLARLATEHPRSTFSWIPLAAAIAVVIAISAALVVTYSRNHSGQITAAAPPIVQHTHNSEAPPTVQTANTNLEAQRSTKTTAHRTARVGARKDERTADREHDLPKLATFPAPSPETAQERQLARLAARRGSYDVAVTSQDTVPLKDLLVPELNIEPLERTPQDDVPQE